jgi:exodeoxyribonuclease V alpha subunit
MNRAELDLLHSSGVLSPLDIHFAAFMAKLAGNEKPYFTLAAALVSNQTREGHICLDLTKIAGRQLPGGKGGGEIVACPEIDGWLKSLQQSPVVGRPGEYKPLVLDDGARLYLYRYWDYQEKLAEVVKGRAVDAEPIDPRLLEDGLSRLFPNDNSEETDWQKIAAFTALVKKFCVISGGPGTGKTTTVARILALLLEQASPEKLQISLAAPTGKGAARLQEAIGRVKDTLECPQNIKEAIPEGASTIHRLLGSIPGSPNFRHNKENHLPVDVVVVDEASMVDLALMSKLVQALHPQARLILLGDRDQLASVEAGAVLGDICDTGNVHGFSKGFSEMLQRVAGYKMEREASGESVSGLKDCIVHLQKNYRFGADSGIGPVSQAVNAGDTDRTIALLKDEAYGDIVWRDIPPAAGLAKTLKENIVNGFGGYLLETEPWDIFRRFDAFGILCALKQGPYGVSSINSLAEEVLAKQNLIDPGKRWYRGRPVMITRNDYNLRLFNGDVGITLPDPDAHSDLRVFFPTTDGRFRRLHPMRLPEHETVYAMTVHKSQGSEFERLLLLLPDRVSPVLTRELIYTAVTRARGGVEIWGREEVLRTAISRRIERMSGLRDALWESHSI